MSVVYGREIDGETTTFGTTGYTHNNVFVLYDRSTESLWYPLSDGAMDAISGSRKGMKLSIIAKPPVLTLGEWKAQHPETSVLVGRAPRRRPSQDDEEHDNPSDGAGR